MTRKESGRSGPSLSSVSHPFTAPVAHFTPLSLKGLPLLSGLMNPSSLGLGPGT